MALPNDAAENRLRRSIKVNTPMSGNSAITHNMSKPPPPLPPFKRPQGQNSHVSYGSFVNNGSTGDSSIKRQRGKSKDTKALFESPSKPYIPDKNVTRERSTLGNKNYDS